MNLYKFYSQSCSPCKMLDLVLDEMSMEGIDLVRVDIAQASEAILDRFQVSAVPTLAYVDENGRVNSMIGFKGPVKTREFVESCRNGVHP